MNRERPKVILTCFAGRRRNMELLLMYTDRLHSMGLLDEMHIWDFSKSAEDSAWLGGAFQRAPLFWTPRYEYQRTGASIGDGQAAEMAFRGHSDAHVLLTDESGRSVAEVSLGAYGNSCSFLRAERQGRNISARGGPACNPYAWRRLRVSADRGGGVGVELDGEQILAGGVGWAPAFPLGVSVAGWNNSEEVRWMVPDADERGRPHPYARLFPVRNKGSWGEYYQHYTSQLYPDHIVIKSDDDIVFIDVDSFGAFLDRRARDGDSILLFPSIVNNGVCAAAQQEMGHFDGVGGGFGGERAMGGLWGDGRMCESLHRVFVENFDEWVARARASGAVHPVPKGERVSINFFAILSKDLYVYQMIGHDDERDITTEVTRRLGRGHSISMGTTVAHLAFYRQRETGLDERRVLGMYRRLAKRVLGACRIRIH